MASRPPRQILPKGGKDTSHKNVFLKSVQTCLSTNEFSVVTAPGAAEIIYVINNSSGGGSGELNTGRRLLNRSLNSSDTKIGAGRPLHIRTDLLPAGLVEDVSCGGGGGEEEVVEEEVIGGEVEYAGEQPGEAEITFIEQEEEHKREEEEEETVTVYEVVGDEECHEEEWVADGLENGEVRESGGDVEEMVFEEEGVEEGEQVIYVTDDGHPVEGDVTFMQVLQNTNVCRGTNQRFSDHSLTKGGRARCRLRGDDRNLSHCRGG